MSNSCIYSIYNRFLENGSNDFDENHAFGFFRTASWLARCPPKAGFADDIILYFTIFFFLHLSLLFELVTSKLRLTSILLFYLVSNSLSFLPLMILLRFYLFSYFKNDLNIFISLN